MPPVAGYQQRAAPFEPHRVHVAAEFRRDFVGLRVPNIDRPLRIVHLYPEHLSVRRHYHEPGVYSEREREFAERRRRYRRSEANHVRRREEGKFERSRSPFQKRPFEMSRCRIIGSLVDSGTSIFPVVLPIGRYREKVAWLSHVHAL